MRETEAAMPWSTHLSFNEDKNRSRTGNAAQNLAIIRRIALNLLKQEKSRKIGITAKRKRAGWDNKYLLKLIDINKNLQLNEEKNKKT